MPLEISAWDSAAYLETPADVALYLEAAFDDGDPRVIAHALGIVARSKGMSAVAREAGVTREALYKALSEDGDPKLTTLLGVMKALGLRLTARAA